GRPACPRKKTAILHPLSDFCGQILDFTTNGIGRLARSAIYIEEMSKVITVPFLRLVFGHHEIGCHRDRRYGFREVFGFRTLQNLPFVHLAMKVKRAYEGKNSPSHKGWPAQREALRWLID